MSDDLGALLEEARALRMSMASGGKAEIHVNAGGVGLWVAVTCCVVSLMSTFLMALGLYWVAMESRDRGHQMNALYQSVPGLRELVERQMQFDRKTEESKTNE